MKKRTVKKNWTGIKEASAENGGRALRAETALTNYQDETGADLEDAVCDLLADIMHWCDRSGHEFETSLRRARMHHDHEAD